MLYPSIKAVGVFVDANPEVIAGMAELGVIDVVQLHGSEDETYLRKLRSRICISVFQAFRVTSAEDVKRAEESSADFVLLDAGAGCGETFDWSLLQDIKSPYFLAGGLTPENVADAIERLHLTCRCKFFLGKLRSERERKNGSFMEAVKERRLMMVDKNGRFGVHGGQLYRKINECSDRIGGSV